MYLRAVQPGKIITSVNKDYSNENCLTGLRIQCAIINSLCSAKDRNIDDARDSNLGKAKGPLAAPPTNFAFPNLPSTTPDFHKEGATDNEKYRDKEFMNVVRVQRAIIDSLFNTRDVTLPKPYKTAMGACLPDLLPSGHERRSVGNEGYGSDTGCSSRGHQSKSQSADPKIDNVTKGGRLLENLIANKKT